MKEIVVTGLGIISPLGDSVTKNHHALKNGICGIGRLDLMDSKFVDLSLFGEVKYSDNQLKNELNAHEKGITRSHLLALHAFSAAIEDSQLSPEELSSRDTALIGASTVGGMCMTDELYEDANRKATGSEYLSSYDCGSIFLYLQERFQLNGSINTINTACSSSANAIMYGARLIQYGLAKRAVVGGVDSLAKFTINGFNALFLLSSEYCRPFDLDRAGLNLGEGAGFLVLEAAEDAAHKKNYAALKGYGNSNDAFHPSSLSDEGDGPFLAMKEALEVAGLKPVDIDYINAHGTGTGNNDIAESKAIIRLFESPPPFSSTKSNIGHTLGAAGAIEAIYAILSLIHQELYPSLHFQMPIAETALSPISSYKQHPIHHVISNSFGFGGNCSSLVFSRKV